MAGPRSNLTYHPYEIRQRVYALKLDGATAAEIAADPAVSASVARTGKKLHGNTLTAMLRSEEYRAAARDRKSVADATAADRSLSAAIAGRGALGSVTDVARYELAREIRGLIASGALSDDPAALEKVARVLVAVSRDDAARLRAENAALKTRIAELEAENAKLREAVPGASSADVAEAMKRKFGVT